MTTDPRRPQTKRSRPKAAPPKASAAKAPSAKADTRSEPSAKRTPAKRTPAKQPSAKQPSAKRTPIKRKATKHTPTRAIAGADDRSRQPRGDARRQQILDAAVQLFAAKGYRGTGVAALAERVGMTAPGLLYYFGTKERLLHEVLQERARAEGADLPSLEEFTLDTIRAVARHNVETALLTRLYVVLGAENLDPGDPLRDYFVERYSAGRAVVAELLAHDQRRGVVAPSIDIEQVAAEVLAVLMGLEIQWLVDPEHIDLIATVDAYIDRLTNELEHP